MAMDVAFLGSANLDGWVLLIAKHVCSKHHAVTLGFYMLKSILRYGKIHLLFHFSLALMLQFKLCSIVMKQFYIAKIILIIAVAILIQTQCNTLTKVYLGFFSLAVIFCLIPGNLWTHVHACVIRLHSTLFSRPACPALYFGAGCSILCHCPPGDTCSPVNGICTSQRCADGWMGASCMIRKTKKKKN